MPTFHPLEPRDYQFAFVCDECLAVVIGMPGHTAWHGHIALPTDGPAPVGPTFPLPDRDVAVDELVRVYGESSGYNYSDSPYRKAGIEAVVTRVFRYLETGR
jgi:hypothetical protein